MFVTVPVNPVDLEGLSILISPDRPKATVLSQNSSKIRPARGLTNPASGHRQSRPFPPDLLRDQNTVMQMQTDSAIFVTA